jgi:magnesium transporter
VIVDAAHYVLGSRQHDDVITLEDAAACPRKGSSFVWLLLHEPTHEQLAELQERFGLHELAVEDARQPHERPKLEQYDDFYYLVFCTAGFDTATREVVFGEVHVFVAPGYVIEIRHGPATEGAKARQRLEQRPQLLKSGPAAAVWGILDDVVDGYGPVVDALEADIAGIEHQVFSGGPDDPTERIYLLTQEVSDFYRIMHPLLVPLDALERGSSFSQIDPALRRYYRDVNDHLKLAHDEVIGLREQLARLLSANLALISLRENSIAAAQNATMKKLTALATIFLPITFVTGFFGQNFAYLVRNMSTGLAFLAATVVQVAVVVGLLVFFRRRDWI